MRRFVVFDVGETIRDDSREFGAWADWLGVPRHTFSAVFGAVRAVGGTTDDAFQVLRPGFDLSVERAARRAAGIDEHFEDQDLYGDVRAALGALSEAGVWVGIAGNQSRHAGNLLRRLDLPAQLILTSEDMGAAKPARAFFDEVARRVGRPPADIMYVGDHRDNDVRPAKAAGFAAALVRRGPFGYLWGEEIRRTGEADVVVNDLLELADLLTRPPDTAPAR